MDGGAEPAEGVRAELRPGTGWAAAAVSALSLALFLWRAAPGVTFEDAGELAAAAATGGVPHPPGYPFLMLVGRAWIAVCAPITDDPARALNLFSACTAAGAVLLLALTVRRLGAGVGAVLVAGLLPMLAHTFAAQAVVTEVYAPAALLQAAVVWAALTLRRPALPTALLLGLAATAHPGSLLFAPLALAALVRESRSGLPSGARPLGLALRSAAAFAAGLLPYLYVPWAAARDPLVNWGGVEGWSSFVAHVTRAQYEVGLAADRTAQAWFVASQSLGQWPLAAAFGLVGCALLTGRRRRAAGVLLATFALAGAALVLALGFPVEAEVARVRLAGACLPLIVLATAWIALGASAFEGRLGSRAAALTAVVAIGLALPLRDRTLAGLVDQRGAVWAESYGRAVLEAAPPRAIVLAGKLGVGDVLAFPVLYRQVVFGERPDLLLVERGLLAHGWYRAQLARRWPELRPSLARLEAELARPGAAADPKARRLSQVPFLQELFDGARPVVTLSRPGPNLLGGREVLAGSVFWHVLPRAEARPADWSPPVPERTPAPSTWLPAEDRDPWTRLLRGLADERRQALE